jgi:hypothetical protein
MLVSIIILIVLVQVYLFFQEIIHQNQYYKMEHLPLKIMFVITILIVLIPINYKIESYLKRLKIWKSNIKLAQIFISFTFLLITLFNKTGYLW